MQETLKLLTYAELRKFLGKISGIFRNLKRGDPGYISGVQFQNCLILAIKNFRTKYYYISSTKMFSSPKVTRQKGPLNTTGIIQIPISGMLSTVNQLR